MINFQQNVLLHGVHTVNLGDDLFFRIIFDRYPNTKFIIKAPEIYKQIFSQYKNCIVLSDSDTIIRRLMFISKILFIPKSILLYLYIFIKFDIGLFLIAGGSLFIEGNCHIPKLVSNIQKLKYIFTNLKLCIIGSNFGPSESDSFKKLVYSSLSKVDDVCFRDKHSFEIFSSLPVARCANDIVMHEIPKNIVKKNKSICVNIRSVDTWETLKENKSKYLIKTKQLIEYYKSKGFKINLISFCNHYGDNLILDELFELLDNKKDVERIYYNGNIEECLNIISSSSIIIATRFHAIVLGLIYGTEVIPISYSIKSENMLKTLGIWSPIYDYCNYCNSDIESIISNKITNFKIDTSKNNQFEYLDKILK